MSMKPNSKYTIRSVTLPPDVGALVEKAVEIEFGGKRSKAYADLLSRGLNAGVEKTLWDEIAKIKDVLREKGIDI